MNTRKTRNQSKSKDKTEEIKSKSVKKTKASQEKTKKEPKPRATRKTKQKETEETKKSVSKEKKSVSKEKKSVSKDNKLEKEVKTKDSTKKSKPKAQTKMSDFIQVSTKKNLELGDGKFSKSKILISSWNINGLRAVNQKDHFKNYIKNTDPDVIALNELKVAEDKFQQENLGQYLPKDYFWYLNFCKPPNAGYAGAAILSKVKPISVIFDIGISKHDQEGRTVTLEFEKFYFVTCYVPNAGEKLVRLKYRTKEWDIDFREFLANLQKKKPVILCGDLNCAHYEIDIASPKSNLKTAGFTIEERTEFTKLLEINGLADSFREKNKEVVKYSFWSYRNNARASNRGWRLDYFLVTNDFFKKAVEKSEINSDILGSDHCPIELTLNLANA